MRFTVNPMSVSDVPGAFEVIKNAFDKYVAPGYCKKGISNFYDYACKSAMSERLETDLFFIATEAESKKIIGMIEVRYRCHISLLFTDPDYHKNGIARALVEAAVQKCSGTAVFEVNASPYAVPVYEHLGFKVIMSEQLKDGIRFVPMKRIIKA